MSGVEHQSRGISSDWTDLIVWLLRLKCAYSEIAIPESSIIIQIEEAHFFNEEKFGNQYSEQTASVLESENDFQLKQERCYVHIHRIATLWNSFYNLRIFG